MLRRFFQPKRGVSGNAREIAPDEIFLDASNLPQFDQYQFEGRLEKPLSRGMVAVVGIVFFLIFAVALVRGFALQVVDGDGYLRQSEENRLRQTIVFGERGIIRDRKGELLAWNEEDADGSAFARRQYAAFRGSAPVVGYMKYPSKDRNGFYYQVDFEGKDGVEKYWSEYIAPSHGMRIVETDVFGKVKSESVQKSPQNGESLTLSIDARLSEKFYDSIHSLVENRGFVGGAAVMMDVSTGEILAMTSVPEYNSQLLTDGEDTNAITKLLNDPKTPFLNRTTAGLYTPGSIVKPFIALGALTEGVITPEKQIVSTGSIVMPNPYNPELPSIFRDWKAHGAVDMRRALAVSSDVYFYEIGGGFEDQAGLGIERIEKYMKMFGFGTVPPGSDFFGVAGVIPNPKWKSENFDGEPWRIGNTYHTSIGQYGFQISPIQAVRAIAAIANGGRLLEPRLVQEGDPPRFEVVPIPQSAFDVVQEGMRDAVLLGTASGLNIPQVAIAAKTGTAELGSRRQFVHSWVIGFFPFEKPRYAFAVVMEKGPRENAIGALFVAREVIEWMSMHTPEYLKAGS